MVTKLSDLKPQPSRLPDLPKAPHALCEQCPYKANQMVVGRGPETASIALVGDGPGSSELRSGRPIAGDGGNLLMSMLDNAGISMSEVYITNAILCDRKYDKKPAPEAIEACRPRLLAELESRKFETIVTLGAEAAYAVTGRKLKITADRGKRIGNVMPTLHPNYVYTPAGSRFAAHMLADLIRSVEEPTEVPPITYDVVEDEVGWSKVLSAMHDKNYEGMAVYDLETTSLQPHTGEILCVVLMFDVGHAFIVTPNLPQWKEKLSNIFNNYRFTWYGHNLQFDNGYLLSHGIQPPSEFIDTMLISYAVDERTGIHGLKDLAQRILGVDDWSAGLDELMKNLRTEWKTKKTKATKAGQQPPPEPNYGDIPRDVLFEYAAKDVVYNGLIVKPLQRRLNQMEKGQSLYDTIFRPTSKLLTSIELHGFRVDIALLKEATRQYEQMNDEIERELAALAGSRTFNPRSPDQVAHVLFNKFKLTPVEFTPKGKPSTSKDVIETLAGSVDKNTPEGRFLSLMLDSRALTKVIGTYFGNIWAEVQTGGGRVHPRLNMHATTTGRLTGGVWLTLPREEKNRFASIIRYLVIADEGHVICASDYDQAELRVVTIEAKDELYRKVFINGEDPHAATTDLLFGTDWRTKPNPKEWRQIGKMTNFLILYGGGPSKLAQSANIDIGLATQAINTYFLKHPAIKKYFDNIMEGVIKNGYVESFFGRRRRFELQTEQNFDFIRREACNMPIQATANDLNLLAASQVNSRHNVLLVMHDSIETQLPEAQAEEFAEEISRTMSDVARVHYSDYVPFTADYGIGGSWGEAESGEPFNFEKIKEG